MKTIISIMVFMMLGMQIVSACAPQPLANGNQETPEETPSVTTIASETSGDITPVTPAGTEVGPAADGQKIITLEDQNKTINLAVGESFLLKLGEEYTWEVNISNQDILSRVKNIAVVRGAQGIYTAHQAGTVTLSAAGDPQCRQAQPPCAMPSIQFEMTIIVK